MKKITIKEIEALAVEALACGNPYTVGVTSYIKAGVRVYRCFGSTYTAAELDAEYLKTAGKDIRAGYEQRAVNYYDKWYRYCRKDGGRAYDLGVQLAASRDTSGEPLNIIELAILP